MRERYAELTRGLAWDPTYVSHEQLYPYTRFEGIKATIGTRGKTRSG